MIVQNTMPEMIAAAVKTLAGRVRDEGTEERMAFYDAYEGRNMAEVAGRYFSDAQKRSVPPTTERIVKKLIDARFCVYKSPPTRTGDERYLKEYIGNIDEYMTYLERMTGLQGTMGMLRFWDGKVKKLDSRVLPVFEPLFLPGEVEPFGVAYPLHDPGQQDAAKREWAVWTTADYFIVSGGRVLPGIDAEGNPRTETAHGLDRLPVLFAHNGPAVAQRWFRPGAVDMVNAQLRYNVLGWQHGLGVLWQSLGQPWTNSGPSRGNPPLLGVDRLLELETGATFRFETAEAKLTEILDSQRRLIDNCAYFNHLQVKWAGGGATSGEHLRMMEVDLTEAVMSDFNRWRPFEDARFALDRVLLESVGITISEEYSVDFAEPHIPDSPAEKREQWTWELQQGLTNKRRILREMNPDMTEEEIDERLAEIDASRPDEPETGVSMFAAALARPVNG